MSVSFPLIEQDPEQIKITKLSQRTHKTRTARKLPCGHEVEAGTPYEKWVGIVDGEFTSDVACFHCVYGEFPYE